MAVGLFFALLPSLNSPLPIIGALQSEVGNQGWVRELGNWAWAESVLNIDGQQSNYSERWAARRVSCGKYLNYKLAKSFYLIGYKSKKLNVARR